MRIADISLGLTFDCATDLFKKEIDANPDLFDMISAYRKLVIVKDSDMVRMGVYRFFLDLAVLLDLAPNRMKTVTGALTGLFFGTPPDETRVEGKFVYIAKSLPSEEDFWKVLDMIKSCGYSYAAIGRMIGSQFFGDYLSKVKAGRKEMTVRWMEKNWKSVIDNLGRFKGFNEKYLTIGMDAGRILWIDKIKKK